MSVDPKLLPWKDDDGKTHLKLENPITVEGGGGKSKKILELVCRPATARDFFTMPATGVTFEHNLRVGASLAGESMALIGKLSVGDMGRLMMHVNEVMGPLADATGDET